MAGACVLLTPVNDPHGEGQKASTAQNGTEQSQKAREDERKESGGEGCDALAGDERGKRYGRTGRSQVAVDGMD